jgi:hypothetical protein
MAAGLFVTWTHCSIHYEVTKVKKARVHADATMRPRGHRPVRADEVISLPPPSLCTPSLTLHGRAVASARTREKNKNKIIFIFIFLGCWLLERSGKKMFPKIPKFPELRGLCERSREKKKVFLA